MLVNKFAQETFESFADLVEAHKEFKEPLERMPRPSQLELQTAADRLHAFVGAAGMSVTGASTIA